jgi:phosphatidylserine decarboxylase
MVDTMRLLRVGYLNIISRLFGLFASKEFPPTIQKFINRAYVGLLKVDMSDFNPPHSYKSLNGLFTRSLVKQRDIDNSIESIISPCDSLITLSGKIRDDLSLQLKGFCYSIDELLGEFIDQKNRKKIYGGEYINFYLSPRDYHRYHMPFDAKISRIVHIPGSLYPVNFKALKKTPELYTKNERVIVECRSEKKLFYIVLIGALNVGKISIGFEPLIETNIDSQAIKVYEYDKDVKKGFELGFFLMGSTVVTLFEKNFIELMCQDGQKVRFGDEVARVLNKKR